LSKFALFCGRCFSWKHEACQLFLPKLSNVIPMLMTGTFRTAIYFLTNITRDGFLTDERLNKYIQMLSAADAIDYDH
jgi:hypothetical protein